MRLKFNTKSGAVAVLGTFRRLTKHDLRRYVLMYPRHWIEV